MTTARIVGYEAVKAAAKDWRRYSSDLQGDRDVRTYRQLPLEADPPRHGAYRAILTPFFVRPAVDALEPAMRAIAAELVSAFVSAGYADAVHDLALPMVVRAIGTAFGRPQDTDALMAWGVDVWIDGPDGRRQGDHVDAYLDRVFAEVAVRPGTDAFSAIAAARIDGRALDHDEQLGLGNLILAGGRDTVVKLIAGSIRHLANDPADRASLADDPARIPIALEELLRFLSPLPRMERIDTTAGPGASVALDFAAANHDPAEFANPDDLDLGRADNRHLAFGTGPHTCIGNHLARLEARVFVEELLDAAPHWRISDGADIEMAQVGGAQVPDRFHRLPIELGS